MFLWAEVVEKGDLPRVNKTRQMLYSADLVEPTMTADASEDQSFPTDRMPGKILLRKSQLRFVEGATQDRVHLRIAEMRVKSLLGLASVSGLGGLVERH